MAGCVALIIYRSPRALLVILVIHPRTISQLCRDAFVTPDEPVMLYRQCRGKVMPPKPETRMHYQHPRSLARKNKLTLCLSHLSRPQAVAGALNRVLISRLPSVIYQVPFPPVCQVQNTVHTACIYREFLGSRYKRMSRSGSSLTKKGSGNCSALENPLRYCLEISHSAELV